jgi:hypothetical protein
LRNRQQVAPHSYIYMKQSVIGFRLAVVSYDVTPACRVTYPATGQGPVQHRGDRHAHRPTTTFNIWEATYPSLPRAVYNIKNVNILRTNVVNIHRYAVASDGQYIHSQPCITLLQYGLHVSARFSGHHQTVNTIHKIQVCTQEFFFPLRARKLHSDGTSLENKQCDMKHEI